MNDGAGRPGGSSIELAPARGRAGLDAFIRVPFALNRDDPNWVPPLLMERRAALDERRNPYFRHAEAAFWIAHRNGRPVGRISAQVDRAAIDRAAERHGEAIGHFGLLEAIDDPAVVGALTIAAEDWLRRRGMRRVQGPFNLSINEECGLLVDGFDTPPMLLMGHAKPHLATLLGDAGYAKAKDLYAYLYDITAELPRSAQALIERVRQGRVTVRPLRMADYAQEISTVVEIFNDAWSGNWGFVPLSRDDMAHMAREMRPLVRERLVWFAEVDGTPAAMAICLPNLNEAIRDLGGRLLPFGWARLLWRLKVAGTKTGRVPLMGVRRSYADSLVGMALPFLVIDALRNACRSLGLERIELSWILEDNLPMRRIIEAIGARRYKTYRLFEKPLA